MVLPIETPICGPRWLLNVTLGNVCFEAYYGLKSDIAPRPKSANSGSGRLSTLPSLQGSVILVARRSATLQETPASYAASVARCGRWVGG
jgi:hypothetical protein